jgi:hypothetical protein
LVKRKIKYCRDCSSKNFKLRGFRSKRRIELLKGKEKLGGGNK